MDSSPWWQWVVVLGAVVMSAAVVLLRMAQALGLGAQAGRVSGGCGSCASCPSSQPTTETREGTLVPLARPVSGR